MARVLERNDCGGVAGDGGAKQRLETHIPPGIWTCAAKGKSRPGTVLTYTYDRLPINRQTQPGRQGGIIRDSGCTQNSDMTKGMWPGD